MSVLIWGILLVWVAFLVHVIVWRICLPKRQTKALVQIFLGTLLIGLFGLWRANLHLSWSVNLNLPAYLHIALFVIAFTLAYILTYSAIEADSPSLVMIMSIARAGAKGLPTEQFEQLMTDERLIFPRIQDLVRDKLIWVEDGKYKLTTKGVWLVRLFSFYRQVLKATPKGG